MKRLREVFAAPALIAAASAFGLICALFADGVWDIASWLGLGLAVLAALRYGVSRPRQKEPSREHPR